MLVRAKVELAKITRCLVAASPFVALIDPLGGSWLIVLASITFTIGAFL